VATWPPKGPTAPDRAVDNAYNMTRIVPVVRDGTALQAACHRMVDEVAL
jgi:hypothetical protein